MEITMTTSDQIFKTFYSKKSFRGDFMRVVMRKSFDTFIDGFDELMKMSFSFQTQIDNLITKYYGSGSINSLNELFDLIVLDCGDDESRRNELIHTDKEVGVTILKMRTDSNKNSYSFVINSPNNTFDIVWSTMTKNFSSVLSARKIGGWNISFYLSAEPVVGYDSDNDTPLHGVELTNTVAKMMEMTIDDTVVEEFFNTMEQCPTKEIHNTMFVYSIVDNMVVVIRYSGKTDGILAIDSPELLVCMDIKTLKIDDDETDSNVNLVDVPLGFIRNTICGQIDWQNYPEINIVE